MKKLLALFTIPLLISLPAFASSNCEQYVSVRYYDVKDSDQVAKIAQKEWVPIIKKIPGFIHWDLIAVDEKKVITVSTFNNQKAAEESAVKAKEWGGKALSELVINPPQISNGKVLASSCK